MTGKFSHDSDYYSKRIPVFNNCFKNKKKCKRHVLVDIIMSTGEVLHITYFCFFFFYSTESCYHTILKK